MKIKTYTPSVNIIRDFDEEINYISTPNAQNIYNQIVSNYQKGSRSFSVIGSYGSGKSSFIVALEQSLNGTNHIFTRARIFRDVDEFQFINLIGEHKSIIQAFSELLKLDSKLNDTGKVLEGLKNYLNDLNNKGLVIVIDEFGKFLEFVAKNNPEKELYFLQQLAEFVNSKKHEVIFITVLHKNFNAYSLELTQNQIDEWNKVKGRFVELNFNEPVEQLLFLAAEKIAEYGFVLDDIVELEKVHSSISKAKLYPLKEFDSLDFSKRIYPFDLLSASILTLALQEYGQNERSLFSFIETEEEFGLFRFNKVSNPFFNIACVYDYLNYYHFSIISTKYNPYLNQWNSIRSALDRIEVRMPKMAMDAGKLIKTIGLLNIFANKGGTIDDEFINLYGKYSLGIDDTKEIINQLVKFKIVRHSQYDNRYKLFHGTDLDFELAINEAGNLIERVKDTSFYLNNYFDFPVIMAKAASFVTGTPRMFSFKISNEPIKEVPEDELDGFINLIFNDKISENKIREHSSHVEDAVLYGLFTNTIKIEDTIFELEKIKRVIEDNADDIIALQELENIKSHYRNLLNHYVLDGLYSDDQTVKWFFQGNFTPVANQKVFNNLLSFICNEVYSATPIFRNELVNKTKISGSISIARKNLITGLLEETPKENLNFDDQKFPPEKSIFLSLIKGSGMWNFREGKWQLTAPTSPSFQRLWLGSLEFLELCRDERKSLLEFSDYLKRRPYKLKQGFVDFWLPVFLITNKNDFALYQRGRSDDQIAFLPNLNDEILDLINKIPQDFYIKKFDLTPARLELYNKYREILNQIEQERFTNASFVETFKPFVIFYKSLSAYAINTKNLSEKSRNLRQAIANAVDPEITFFEEFPNALGLNTVELLEKQEAIEDFAISIKDCVQEINGALDVLIEDIETYINTEIFGEDLIFPENKVAFSHRFAKLKTDRIQPKYNVFFKRLISLLDNKKAWINSLCQAILGKNIDTIKDDEISVLKHKIIDYVRELDNFTEISERDINPDKEDVIKLEVTDLLKGLSKKYIRIPKSKMTKIANLEKSYKEQLRLNDRTVNIALLVKLLQDELKEDEES